MVQYLADIYEAVSSACKGMGITIKHIWKKPVTLQYPDERWVMPERFRGFVFNDLDLCNGCAQCAKACPVSCIYIETEGKGKDRFMTRYAIDYNKCIWCGFCCDPCPESSITMSHDYDHSVYFRQSYVHEYISPDRPIPCHKVKRAEMGFYVRPEKPKPAKSDKPKADKPKKTKTDDKEPAADKPEVTEAVADKPTAAVPEAETSPDASAPETEGGDDEGKTQ